MLKNNWKTIAIGLLSIALIGVTVFAINTEKKRLSAQKPDVLYIGYDDKQPMENFTREKVIQAARELLENLNKDVEGKNRTPRERYEYLIENEDADLDSVFTKETIDSLYFGEEFGNDIGNRKMSAIALLDFSEMIKRAGENQIILDETVKEFVYMDSKLKRAHVPLDAFALGLSGIAFEMQYIDGEWKLNPYTTAMSFHLIGIIFEEIDKQVDLPKP